MKVPPEVQAVLGRAEIRDGIVRIHEQLDRPLYVKVDKVLTSIGGKWDRRIRGHVFQPGVDPAAVIAAAVNEGEVVSLKSDLDFFPTPPPVVDVLLRAAQPVQGLRVMEPSAGLGAIAGPLRSAGAFVHCVEIDPGMACELVKAGFYTLCADFLTVKPEGCFANFDRVVMNPPFSKGRGLDHVTHAMKFLRPGGRLVAVLPAGIGFREDKKHKAFRSFIEKSHGQVITLADRPFKESGTGVSALVVVVERGRKAK